MSIGVQRATNDGQAGVVGSPVAAQRKSVGNDQGPGPASRDPRSPVHSKSRSSIPTCSARFFFLMPMARPCVTAPLPAFPANTHGRRMGYRSVLASDLAARLPTESSRSWSPTSPRTRSGQTFARWRSLTVCEPAGQPQLLRRTAQFSGHSPSTTGSLALRTPNICNSSHTPLIWRELRSNTTGPRLSFVPRKPGIALWWSACPPLLTLRSSEPTGPGTT